MPRHELLWDLHPKDSTYLKVIEQIWRILITIKKLYPAIMVKQQCTFATVSLALNIAIWLIRDEVKTKVAGLDNYKCILIVSFIHPYHGATEMILTLAKMLAALGNIQAWSLPLPVL